MVMGSSEVGGWFIFGPTKLAPGNIPKRQAGMTEDNWFHSAVGRWQRVSE